MESYSMVDRGHEVTEGNNAKPLSNVIFQCVTPSSKINIYHTVVSFEVISERLPHKVTRSPLN